MTDELENLGIPDDFYEQFLDKYDKEFAGHVDPEV